MAACRFQAFLDNFFRCVLTSGQHCEGVGEMRDRWVDEVGEGKNHKDTI